MKRTVSRGILVLVSLLFAASLIISCGGGGGGGGGGGDNGQGSKITVKGTFNSVIVSWPERLFAWMSPHSADAFDPNEVTKVVLFTGDSDFVVANVTNGNFSVDVNQKEPWGVVFAGIGDTYLGYLTLSSTIYNSIDSLPLSSVNPNVTTIDLQQLTSIGNTVSSSYNPIGTEIPLSAEEQEAIEQADDFLASVVKNPDVDGNGKLDVLDGKFYSPWVMYFIDGGAFGAGLTPTLSNPATITDWRFCMTSGLASSYPSSVTFTGPGGSGLNNDPDEENHGVSNIWLYCSKLVQSDYPPEGQYTVDYDSTPLTFTLSDQSGAPSRVVLPVPTVTVDGSNNIQNISWTYQLPGGSSAMTPSSVIKQLEVQIEGSGTSCGNYSQGLSRLYNSGMVSPSVTQVTPSCQLNWNNVSKIYMAYADVYGNHNVVEYPK